METHGNVMKSGGAGLFETGQQVAVAVAASWQILAAVEAESVTKKNLRHWLQVTASTAASSAVSGQSVSEAFTGVPRWQV